MAFCIACYHALRIISIQVVDLVIAVSVVKALIAAKFAERIAVDHTANVGVVITRGAGNMPGIKRTANI